jgi:heme/copper-type cytochrome/quinol oxidase subunit 2
MATTAASSVQLTRRPSSAFRRLTAGTLVGVTLVMLGFMVLALRTIEPILIGIAAIPLIAAAGSTLRWRWAPLLATLVFAVLALLLLAIVRELALTYVGGSMLTLLVLLAPLVLVGLPASIGAVVQSNRSTEPRTPAWLAGTLLLLGGLSVGAAMVSLIPPPGAAVGVSQAALDALPAVTVASFDGRVIHVRSSQTVALRLKNEDPVAHGFAIDELGVNAPMPAGADSLALFEATTPGAYRFYCPPHYDKASGTGMHGTLIVEP